MPRARFGGMMGREGAGYPEAGDWGAMAENLQVVGQYLSLVAFGRAKSVLTGAGREEAT